MGDFTGFTFGDWRSADPITGEVTVVRVSGGDRYEEQLHPEIKDITAEVPGMDGEYYFGSNYGTKTIDIEIAFDHLTEVQFRRLRQVFGTRQIKQLIFDERPYKYYMAKIESPMELSYVCFDEPKKHIDTSGNARGVRWVEEAHTETVIDEETEEPTDETVEVTERVRETIYPYVRDGGTECIYKGEGKISFICHFPFAKSVYKQIPIGEEGSDWAISSGIKSVSEYKSNNIDTYNNGNITLYNPGDLETGFCLYLPAPTQYNVISNPEGNPKQKGWYEYIEDKYELTTDTTVDNGKTYYQIEYLSLSATTINYLINSTNVASLVLKELTVKSSDIGVLIDTNNGLILGVSDFYTSQDGNKHYTTSGNLYNEYIQAGYFFKIQRTNLNETSTLQITGAQSAEIFYDYLYF